MQNLRTGKFLKHLNKNNFLFYLLFINNILCILENSFIIKNINVIPIFDYVHLIKGVRNNLLTKDLDTDINNKYNNKKYATWDHIVTTYNIDKESLMKKRQMPKITDRHIIPKLIPKMKVKYATQILSKTVANFIDVILNLSGGKKDYIKNIKK